MQRWRAARASRPLLLADIPVYRELWDGAAEFFDPCDARMLAQRIDALAADPARRESLGQLARRRAAAYEAQAQRQAMTEVWRSVLSAASRPLETT